MSRIHVTIWNEGRHEKTSEVVAGVYPAGIHGALASGLAADDLEIRTGTLDDPDQGLSDSVLQSTDVLIWWGHCAHQEVADELVRKIHKRVLEGMGLIVLHSGHFSKIFRAVTGCSCSLSWREVGEKERLWNIAPFHPIMNGIGRYFELEHEEMYSERFDIPGDAQLLMIGWFEGGNVFRSAFTLERGYGKVFYFQPGHETYATFFNPDILKVIGNAVRWAKPVFFREMAAPCEEAIEVIRTVNPHDPSASAGLLQNADGSNR
ncbi:MAG: ThuA domain-containing protein [Victivallaceae bacterium]|nr:ThuA domain-containing protein [Victivallaceae bacterium]